MGDWIDVNERMPVEETEVLVAVKHDNSPLIAYHSKGVWYEKCDNLVIHGDAWYETEVHAVGLGDVGYQITHWSPLMEMPK